VSHPVPGVLLARSLLLGPLPRGCLAGAAQDTVDYALLIVALAITILLKALVDRITAT
jgi:hypothetical protein